MSRSRIALLSCALLAAPLTALAAPPSSDSGRACAKAGTCPGAAPANTPRLNATNIWSAYQIIGLNPLGVVNPRMNVGLQIVPGGSGEMTPVDAFAYNGDANIVSERYDYADKGFRPVGKGESVGGYWGAAFTGKGDPVDAGIGYVTTELQTPEHNGMDLELHYTPNGSTALGTGLSVSPHGNGGVTVGNEYVWGKIADLGNGTLDAADSIVTANHFRTSGRHPAITACGADPSFTRGTDQAGAVTTGGAVTSCTVSFAKAWASAPVCMVQLFDSAAAVPYLTSEGAGSITVAFSAAFNGVFQYLCMGVS